MTTRIESMMRSTPRSRATAPAGMAPSEEAVADRARKAEPGMPAMPLLVSISTRTTVTCWLRLRSTPTAWAMNSVPMDR